MPPLDRGLVESFLCSIPRHPLTSAGSMTDPGSNGMGAQECVNNKVSVESEEGLTLGVSPGEKWAWQSSGVAQN